MLLVCTRRAVIHFLSFQSSLLGQNHDLLCKKIISVSRGPFTLCIYTDLSDPLPFVHSYIFRLNI